MGRDMVGWVYYIRREQVVSNWSYILIIYFDFIKIHWFASVKD